MIKKLKEYLYESFVAEISAFSRYYDKLIQYNRLPNDKGWLFEAIASPQKIMLPPEEEIPDLSQEQKTRSLILLNGILNHSDDIQGLLKKLKQNLSRSSRLVVVAYNPYLKWIYKFATLLGIRKGPAPSTFVTFTALNNLCKIAGYEIIRSRPVGFFPFKWIIIGPILNRVMPIIPIFKYLGLAYVIVLRPIIAEKQKPSLSIVIPARNEKQNIENAILRMPEFAGTDIEIIFIEGHSDDETWEEIQRVKEKYASNVNIKAYQQSGIGKSDAVNLGFSHAGGDLFTILDADLTMPPEQLEQFYNVYCEGLADFVNGSRLVYPMEKEAMRFLNQLGNVFFAKMLSYVLDAKLSDSLCGTKLFSKHDYCRILSWRNEFGKFDPFGDFELLFPAAVLSLGIIDVPIRYRSRTYGDTNISRFRHGWMLFKMLLIGFLRIKLGR